MKYKLTENTRQLGSKTLYQIQAVKDFSDVKKGDLGGWIESESNLSQSGNSWVYDNAIVAENALVYENAIVAENVKVSENAVIHGNAILKGNVIVCDNTIVHR